jgi:hypothetical protein
MCKWLRNLYLPTTLAFFSAFTAMAQSSFVPTGSETYHLIDRLEIQNGALSKNLHTSTKPYSRSQIASFLNEINDSGKYRSVQDKFNIAYLSTDNFDETGDSLAISKKPVLRKFYTEKPFLFSHYEEDFELYINPVLDAHAGFTDATSGNKSIYTNTRGAEIRGSIAGKVGFYTYVTENQARLPYFVDQRVDSNKALPGVGFLKGFGTNGYDYLQARGYITFSTAKNHINFTFGHDRNMIGNGVRSLILSDFAREYLFFKVNTKVWKFDYENLFMELFNGNSFTGVSNLVEKKFAVNHHLSYNVAKNLNIGLSETVIFSRNDTLGSKGFELNYLNPIIFYRSVEQNLNSADNAMVALDYKWNFAKHFSMYGQFILDEFVISELRAGNGWWANKFGIQTGLKYIDVLNVNNLDFQVEGNIVRPYTYTHFRTSQNMSHYGQQLAHPLGANFYEILAIARYQPAKRLNLRVSCSYAVTGQDTGLSNMGGNIFKNYNTRYSEYGNTITQGDKTTILYLDVYSSYMIKHNVFIWGSLSNRNSSSTTGNYTNKEMWVSLGLRLNIPHRQFLF